MAQRRQARRRARPRARPPAYSAVGLVDHEERASPAAPRAPWPRPGPSVTTEHRSGCSACRSRTSLVRGVMLPRSSASTSAAELVRRPVRADEASVPGHLPPRAGTLRKPNAGATRAPRRGRPAPAPAGTADRSSPRRAPGDPARRRGAPRAPGAARGQRRRGTGAPSRSAAATAASALGDGPSGFSLDATFSAPVMPSSRSSSSIGLPGW
jgi:hypothetical protein